MDKQDTERRLGVWLGTGLGNAWPEVKDLAAKIYGDRVAGLPWVPSGWLTEVRALQLANPQDVVRPSPAVLVSGLPYPDAPAWIDSTEKRQVWQDLFQAFNEALGAYAADKAAAGRAELNRLWAAAAFWDFAYRAAVAIRDAPANLVATVADGVGSAFWSSVSRLARSPGVWFLGAVALGFLGWRRGWFRRGGGRNA